jgi:hypothetical protein
MTVAYLARCTSLLYMNQLLQTSSLLDLATELMLHKKHLMTLVELSSFWIFQSVSNTAVGGSGLTHRRPHLHEHQ